MNLLVSVCKEAANLKLPGRGISAKVPQLSDMEQDTEMEPRQEPETAKHQRSQRPKEMEKETEKEQRLRGRRGRTEGEKKARPTPTLGE